MQEPYVSCSHFIACGMLRWKGFAGILLYRHIKAFITHNVDMGPKRIRFCFLPRGLSEAPMEVGAPGLDLRRLDPREEEVLAVGKAQSSLG